MLSIAAASIQPYMARARAPGPGVETHTIDQIDVALTCEAPNDRRRLRTRGLLQQDAGLLAQHLQQKRERARVDIAARGDRDCLGKVERALLHTARWRDDNFRRELPNCSIRSTVQHCSNRGDALGLEELGRSRNEQRPCGRPDVGKLARCRCGDPTPLLPQPMSMVAPAITLLADRERPLASSLRRLHAPERRQ